MSFKEVTTLRKSGKLDEALKMAKTDLSNDPDGEWPKRAIVWVYYEYMKLAFQKNDFEEIISQIENINKLKLPKNEKIVFSSVAWLTGKYLFANKQVSARKLNTIFKTIKKIPFPKPDDSYSFLLKAFKKHDSDDFDFLKFMDWWDINNFQDVDYKNYILENGTKMPSLVESVYIKISKLLLKEPYQLNKIDKFLPSIASVSKNYSNMQYPTYYYAKLLLATGNKEMFFEAFLPFARKKQRDFWVWDLISEIYDSNSDEYMSCLCKSLSCGAPDKFTGNVREKLAKRFIKNKQYSYAKFELSKIIESRKQEGWSIQKKHSDWQKLEWWNSTEAARSNSKVYEQNISIAESLLFADVPEEIVVIEKVNGEKSIINFVVSKEKSGFSSYRKLKIKPKQGDIYAVRFMPKTDEKSNFYVISSLRECTRKPPENTYKVIEGKVEIKQGNSFGFVAGAFVPPPIVTQYNLKDGTRVKAAVINRYNSKRKVWGWNVIEIIK